MSEPTDNIPTEWPMRGRSFLRERLSLAHWRRLMVSFAKFVIVNVDVLPADEMLDAWIDLTYNKPEKAEPEIVEKYGYRERPRSTATEISEPTLDAQYLPEF